MKKKIIIDITSSTFNSEECEERLEDGTYKVDEEGNIYQEQECEGSGESEQEANSSTEQNQEQSQETQQSESQSQSQDEQQGEEETQSQEQQPNSDNQTPQDPKPEKPHEQADFSVDNYIKPAAYNLAKEAIDKKLNVLLTGPAGVGKTRMCSEIAHELNIPFYCEASIGDEFVITGFKDANGVYQESNFYKAFIEGGLFLFDELDGSDPNACLKFNSAIANGFCIFPNGMKYAHPDFRCVATANTIGHGADMVYVGRNQLDAATLDRFKPNITMNYEKKIEAKLTKDIQLLDFIRNFRKGCEQNSILKVVSYRTIKTMDALKESKFYSKEDLIKTCLTYDLDKADMRIIQNSMGVLNDNAYMEAFKVVIKNADK